MMHAIFMIFACLSRLLTTIVTTMVVRDNRPVKPQTATRLFAQGKYRINAKLAP
jgi:hypothetical protein